MSYIEVWFAYWNSKPLEIEEKISFTLVINKSVKYRKIMRYSVQPLDQIFLKGYSYSFTSCISRINNTQLTFTQSIDVVISIYNLIKYNDNYEKISGILWQYCRDELAVDGDDAIRNF